MLKYAWFLLLALAYTSIATAEDSTSIVPTSNVINTGYNLVNIMHLNSNASSPSYSPTCPTGSSFAGGQYLNGATTYYAYNCNYLNIPANSTLAAQIAAMANGFTSCPEDPSNPNLQCTSEYNTYPITLLQTNSCQGFYCETSASFGDVNNNYAEAFSGVGGSPSVTQITTNGTRGGGWDLYWPSQNASDDGLHTLSISAYIFGGSAYEVFISSYRSGGWTTTCPVYTSGGSAGQYNGSTITFLPSDIGKTCTFSCSGNNNGPNAQPNFYWDSVTKNCN